MCCPPHSADVALTRFMVSKYLSCFLPAERYPQDYLFVPGFAFPSVGPLGLGSSPSRPSYPDHRYYAPLRLPAAHHGFLRSSLVRRYPNLLPFFCVPLPARHGREATRTARAFVLPVSPYLPASWRETAGSPKFPSYPCEHMPRSQTPVVSLNASP